MADDEIKQRLQRAFAGGRILADVTAAARTVENREVQLLFGGLKRHEQVEHFVQNLIRAAIGTVDLVHHHDRAQAQRQRLAGDELGLRHRSFGGVHQKNDAIDHGEDALNLAAEVGVARRIHDIDTGVAPGNGRALGKNGDAALALQIATVHRALFNALVVSERARVAEKLIDQSGLAMIDVSDNCDVAQSH